MTAHPPGSVRRSRPALVLTVLTVGVLFLAACGGGTNEKASGVASLSGGAATTTVAKGATTDTRKLWLDAAACLRKNGLDFPDPTFDANGRPQFSQNGQERGPGAVFRQDDPKTQTARTACKTELDKIRSQFAPTPEEAAQRKQQILAMAACMRDQGVDFPDPTFDANGRPQFNGSGGSGGPGGGTDRRDDPAFQKAREACRAKLGDQFPGRPGGGGPGGSGGGGTPTTAKSGNA
jgi:hypothetical protein